MPARSPRSPLQFVLAVLTLLLLAIAPAHAEYGTRAWAERDLTLFQGPESNYAIIGGIPNQSRLIVTRCQPKWCFVAAGHDRGWAVRDFIEFGQQPSPPLFSPQINTVVGWGGPGQVCLFEGTHYSGASTCYESGFETDDLLRFGLDNRYASATVEGDVSALLCRDRDFRTYCKRIAVSTPSFDRYLIDTVTSVRID